MRPTPSRAVVAALAAVALPTTAAAAPLPVDPDEPPPAALDTAPRLALARAYAAPVVRARIAARVDAGRLGDGDVLRAIPAYAGANGIDLGPLRTLLADPAAVEDYVSGGDGLSCYDASFSASVLPQLLIDVLDARDALGVDAPDVDPECDPAALLADALRSPAAFADDTSTATLADAVRALLAAGGHVRADAADELAARGPAAARVADPELAARVLRGLLAARAEGYGGLSRPTDQATARVVAAQRIDGGYGRGDRPSTTGATATVAVALRAAGADAAARRAAAFVTTRQFSAATAPRAQDVGAIANDYPALFAASDAGGIADAETFAASTVAAIPALVAGAYAPPAVGSEASPPAATPVVPPAPGTVPAAPPAHPGTPKAPVVRVAVRRVAARTVGRTGVLRLTVCTDGPATGTVRLLVGRAQARRIGLRAGRAATVLATARLDRRAAGTSTVRLALTAPARRALRTTRHPVRVQVVVALRGAGGTTTRTARVLRR